MSFSFCSQENYIKMLNTIHQVTQIFFYMLVDHVKKFCLLVRYLKYTWNIHKVEMKLVFNSDQVAVFSVYVFMKK
jgi:hypothetical protein